MKHIELLAAVNHIGTKRAKEIAEVLPMTDGLYRWLVDGARLAA